MWVFGTTQLLSPASLFSFPKFMSGFGESVAVRAVEQTLEVLVQAGTGFHHSQMLLTEGNGTQTIRRGSDTAELCTACPCTPRAPSNIEAFPSAIVKSLEITALQEKNLQQQHTFTSEGWRTASSPDRALQASGQHLLPGSS